MTVTIPLAHIKLLVGYRAAGLTGCVFADTRSSTLRLYEWSRTTVLQSPKEIR